MLGLSRHSFYATADGVGAGGDSPPATRLADYRGSCRRRAHRKRKKMVDYFGKRTYTTSHEPHEDHQQHRREVRHRPLWPTSESGPPRVRVDPSRCGEETSDLQGIHFPP
jgi:hypothetical protein